MILALVSFFQIVALPTCAEVREQAMERYGMLVYLGAKWYPDSEALVLSWGDPYPAVHLMFREPDTIRPARMDYVGQCVTDSELVAQWVLVQKADFK